MSLLSIFLYVFNTVLLLGFSFRTALVTTKDHALLPLHALLLKAGSLFLVSLISILAFVGLVLQSLNMYTLTLVILIFHWIARLYYQQALANRPVKNRWMTAPTKAIQQSLKDSICLLSKHPAIAMMAALTVILLLYKVTMALAFRPYAYDATAYHLPNLVDYIQQEKIFMTDKVIWSNVYPKSIEMLNLWQLLYFRDGLTVHLPQFLLTIFGALAVYGILRQQKILPHLAFLGSLCYLSFPVMLSQMTTAYIDTALASLFAVSLYFLLKQIFERDSHTILYLGILLGLMLGTKYSSVGYCAVFLMLYAIGSFCYHKKIWITLQNAALICTTMLITGGYWYGLNWIWYKNPLYPFKFSIFGYTLFPGIDVGSAIMDVNTPLLLKEKPAWLQVFLSWLGLDFHQVREQLQYPLILFTSSGLKTLMALLSVNYDQQIGGFGYLWLFFLFPAILILLWIRIRKKAFFLGEALLYSSLLLCFVITPSNWWARYTCFILILGIYAFIRLLDEGYLPAKILPLLILPLLLSFLQGSRLDFKRWDIIQKAQALDASPLPLRSSYSQSFYTELGPILRKINSPQKAYRIFAFDGPVYSYYFQGDYTQNELRHFFQFPDAVQQNYTMDSYEKVSKLLLDNQPDFILSLASFQPWVERFVREHGKYQRFTPLENPIAGFEKIYIK